jgi:hypothetical protein
MLSLIDPSWRQYKANYTDGAGVANLLLRAEGGEPLDNWYDDLFQELCHQYTVSEAAYPASPHLVRLASSHPDLRVPLLILLGACHTSAKPAQLTLIPEGVAQEWSSAANEAIPMIASVLAGPQMDEPELRYLLASLAAVKGFPILASAIEALDDYPGTSPGL